MNLIYEKTSYVIDDTLAIKTWLDDGRSVYPYGDVTVNLSGYGMTPEEGHVFLPTYKMTDEYYKQICGDIIDRIVCPVQIGYGMGVYAKLKDGWEKSVRML